MEIFPIAEALAADLAGARVDPNEAQKALAYLRSKRSSKALFDYLQAVVNNGQAVIRSRQTLDYYRSLQAACQRHLRPLQGDYDQLLLAFAWSLRLLRYYRAVPQAAGEKAQQQRAVEPPPQPSGPQMPEQGAIFAGKVLDLDDDVVMVEVPGFRQEDAIGVIKARVEQRPRYRAGNSARVEVVAVRRLKSGRTILELQPAPQTKPA